MGEISMDEPGIALQFPPLPGEKVLHLGKTADGTIALTDYRLFLHSRDGSSSSSSSSSVSLINIPVASIETVEMRDIFYIALTTKESAQVGSFGCLGDLECVRLFPIVRGPQKISVVVVVWWF